MKTVNAYDSGLHIRYGAALDEYTTFQLGGACRLMISCRTPEELERAVRYASALGMHYVLIGGGSNVLVSDKGVDAAVIRYFSDEPLIHRKKNMVEVAGSAVLDHLVGYAADTGLGGINYCSGIPGTVGGAVLGNAGAFGRQIGDAVESVTLMNERGETWNEPGDALDFSYRRSRLQRTGEIVVSCRLELENADRNQLSEERRNILKMRSEKHPDWRVEPCIGSIFRNIEPTSSAGRRKAAGWFLEQAGAKDFKVGGAVVFDRHANIIVKRPGGTAQDVFDLAARMEESVFEEFGMRLVREVRYLGLFKGDDPQIAAEFH